MKVADTLVHERASLEQELASHRSLIAAIQSAQVRLEQARKERDEAVAVAAHHAKEKTFLSQVAA